MTGQLETVVDGLGFVEGLRYRSDRLWFSDFGGRRVRSWGADGMLDEAWVPGQPSGLGFAPDGSLLVVSVHEGHLLRFSQDGHLIAADIGASYRGGLNDMLTTPDGRCYISAFPVPLVGEPSPDVPPDGGNVPLFLVDSDGSVRRVCEGLKIPNGIAISADGSVLYVAETMANRLLAFDVAPDGSLSGQRVHADLAHRNPDGISIDRAGNIWVGCPFVSEFVRVNAAGEVDLTVPVPGLWAVSCAVGASDGELWCGVVRTTIEDYKQGRAEGAIMRWRG
jgi:sugar lactone lactonase YvrE